MIKLRRVAVFCGSNSGARPSYEAAARSLGREIAGRGLGLVYGGGNVGLMGSLADAAIAAGGEVIGVIPDALRARELAHAKLAELRVVGSMHERKATMAELSDAFVVLPGGFGTYEEFCEILTWAQLGLHSKPCGIFDVEGFYAALLSHFDHATAEGFVSSAHRSLVLVAYSAAEMLDALERYEPIVGPKWIDRSET
jgi:uncharacterized protein (TIGR00730 family)